MGELFRLRAREPREDAPGAAVLPPPHDLEAERATLSACLLDGSPREDGKPTACDVVAEALGADAAAMFFDPANGRVWQAIHETREARTPVDLATVNAQLRAKGWAPPSGSESWAVYLGGLADASPALANVEHHARLVLERWEDRQLLAAAQRVAAEGRAIPGDRAAWRATVRAEMGRLTAPRVKLAGAVMGAAVREARAHVQAVVDGRVVGVRWGLGAIDDLVGLLARGRQHIVAGLSEHGKTALAFQVGVCVAETPPDALGMREAVYWLSGEMRRRDLVFRGACSMAGVDARHVEAGHAKPDELARIGDWLNYLAKLPIIVDDVPATPAELAARVRARKAEFATGRARDDEGNLFPRCRMQLVIGDNLQRLAMLLTGVRDKFERIAVTSKDWGEDIAKGCDVATLLLSQLNNNILADDRRAPKSGKRNSTKDIRWPRANDLYGASEIKNDADTIIAVHRPELVDDDAPDWRGLAGIVKLKGRFGGDRQVRALRYDKGYFHDDVATPE